MDLIGLWIRSIMDDDYPPPQSLVGELDPFIRRKVAAYLDEGEVFCVYRDCSWCRFLCGHAGSNVELTDGKWVWPGDLSHSVRDHGVVLPNEFICHAMERPSRPPNEDIAPERIKGIPDDSFWIRWCGARRSAQTRRSLEETRKAFLVERTRLREVESARLENEMGTTNETCHTAGCAGMSLLGKRLCAMCVLDGRRYAAIDLEILSLRSFLTSLKT